MFKKTVMKNSSLKNVIKAGAVLSGIGLVTILHSCTSSSGNADMQPPPPTLPVLTISNHEATVYREFPATVEGKVNVEIRPQVDGYLDRIYVDEGSYVKKGQPLFHIEDLTYTEQLNN